MTMPPWNSNDDRPGVTTAAKVCPDCATFDAAQMPPDPRAGLRPATAFGRNIRSTDGSGLQFYCRFHAQQRRKREALSPAPDSPGPLSGAAVLAVQEGYEGCPPAPEGPDGATEMLLTSLTELGLRLQALETRAAPGTRMEELRQALAPLEERVVALEEAVTAPRTDGAAEEHPADTAPPVTTDLDLRLRALAERLDGVERVQQEEAQVLGPDAHEPANTRSLRRWVKQIGKENQTQHTRIERVEAKVAEAIRLAQAAGRVGANRTNDRGADYTNLKEQLVVSLTPLLLGALDAHITEAVATATTAPPAPEALEALVTQTVDARLSALVTAQGKEIPMAQITTPSAPTITLKGVPDTTPESVRRMVEGVLVRHASGLRNVTQIERDGLLDAEDIALITERISQRSAAELCRYIMDLCAQARSEDER